jgi:DNA repair exonuclease SbcCD ATPase subunit
MESSFQAVENVTQSLSSGADRLLGMVHAQDQRVRELEQEVASLTKDVEVLTYSSTTLEALLKNVSLESLTTLEQLITYGLRVVFADQKLSLKTELTSKRGAPWLDLKLLDKGVEAPILESFGGGPASVVAFLLRLLICRRLGLSPVLLLDEPFSFVSEGYVENVAKLLRELTDKLGFKMILVTHDRGFLSYADVGYEARETSSGAVLQRLKLEA